MGDQPLAGSAGQTAVPSFGIRIVRDGPDTCIDLIGELNDAATRGLECLLDPSELDHPCRVVIDLTHLVLMADAGALMLLDVARALRAHNSVLVLRSPSRDVQVVLGLLEADRFALIEE